MGSKHTPPRWWRDYDAEVAAFNARPEPPRNLYGELTIEVNKPELAGAQIAWQCYEVVGVECLTSGGDPITPNMVTHVGMEILVPTAWETYVRAVIRNEATAESENTLWMLQHDPIRGLVCTGGINKRALAKLELPL